MYPLPPPRHLSPLSLASPTSPILSPWPLQDKCPYGLSRSPWHQTRAPSGRGSRTYTQHISSWSAAHKGGKPEEATRVRTVKHDSFYLQKLSC